MSVCEKGVFLAMAGSLRFVRSTLVTFPKGSGRFRALIAALLLILPVLCVQASAQNTTISGTVFDPRTTASSLPLPNVLVYATTGTVAPLPPGVQCLTASSPTGVVSYTTTAVDGSFTLADVPVNATYTLVIQAGKWRRQFTETVTAAPLTGLVLHMPADHTQGDIPLIAIATGSADGLECVFRHMGIADTEFTDDNGAVNPGGRIHLYKGSGNPGADISPSTPSQTTLMGTATDSSLLNSYDMVMFPCQGTPSAQSTAVAATNLVNYANAGGRVFTTHYSYAWLDPDPPYDSQIPPVAKWDVNQSYAGWFDPGTAFINQNFTDGAMLAQWLLNSGASTQIGLVQLSTLRHDLDSVIPPTQAWATLQSTVPTENNAIMQFTFNAPVGAPAANQCGRVLYNEYHVINQGSGGTTYPTECTAETKMSPQEEMLEFALFDLSSFVTPVVVPSLSIAFDPSPVIVKQNDSADQIAVDATNTSATEPIYSSAVLTLALPPGLVATTLADSTGGWTCALGTLTCTRTTIIAAGASDSVTLTVSVPTYPPGGLASYKGQITATVSSPNFSNNVTASDTVIFQQPPAINWATPAPIVYGTPLSAAQLDATSPLQGSFAYSPAAGTVLPVGAQTLTATFAPTDTTDYTTGTATVTLTVLPANPVVLLSASPNPAFISNPVTFTAAIPSFGVAPTGTVNFLDGTTPLGSAAVSAGSATFTTSALTLGTHSITAVYSGDSSYTPATSGALSETLQDFTVALTGNRAVTGTATVSIGGVASYPLVISPVGGATLPAAVSLSVTGLPLGLIGVFTPATVAANSAATNVTLQVGPPGKADLQPRRDPFRGSALPVALGLILLPFAARLRKRAYRWRGLAVLALAGAALAAGFTGCGFHMTPQSSSLTITAASGALSHTLTVNLTVQ
jgi:hypothetical protein